MSTLDPTLDAEPSAPTLPVVELHPERLRAPGPDDRLDALRAAMLAGGLLSELPAGLADDEADPRVAIRQLQAHYFDALRADEGLRAAASVSHQIRLGDVPIWLGLLLAMQPCVFMSAGQRAEGDALEILAIGAWLYIGPAVGVVALATALWLGVQRRKRAQSAEVAALRAARAASLDALMATAAALAGRCFVVQGARKRLFVAGPLPDGRVEVAALRAAGEGAAAEALEAEVLLAENSVERAIRGELGPVWELRRA